MNIAAPQPARPLPVPVGRLVRLTVEQYHRMAETGVLKSGDRIELLEGLLVRKMTHNPPHDSSLLRLDRRLTRLLPDDWLVRPQCAITLKDSEPEPDIAIVRGPESRYDYRHPGPRDIAIVIEVAESSLMDDRRYKGELYARARIPVFWIVNLVDGLVEVYTGPKGGKTPAYRDRTDYGRGDAVPVVLDGQELVRLPVRDLLPAEGGPARP